MSVETVGERLRRLRKDRNLSQRALSIMVPVTSHPYISRLESGDRQASLVVLRELAKALEVSATYLETGQDHICPHCGSVLDGK